MRWLHAFDVKPAFIKKIPLFLFCFVLAGPVFSARKKTILPPSPAENLAARLSKRSTPGAAHEALLPMVGKWNVELKIKAGPTSKVEICRGVSDISLVHGGRFLKQEMKGDWGKMSYEGLGLTGFNSSQHKYETLWIDNLNNGMTTGAGTFDPLQRKLLLEETSPGDPSLKTRSEWQIVDLNRHIWRIFKSDLSGAEYVGVEFIYTRK